MDREKVGGAGPQEAGESPVGLHTASVSRKVGWALVLALETALIALWALYGRSMPVGAELRENVSADHPLAPFLYNCVWLVLLTLGVMAGALHRWATDEHILRQGIEEWRAWKKRGGPGT